MRMQTDVSELLKDKRYVVGGILGIVFIVGGITAYFLNSGVSNNTASLPAPGASGAAPAPPGASPTMVAQGLPGDHSNRGADEAAPSPGGVPAPGVVAPGVAPSASGVPGRSAGVPPTGARGLGKGKNLKITGAGPVGMAARQPNLTALNQAAPVAGPMNSFSNAPATYGGGSVNISAISPSASAGTGSGGGSAITGAKPAPIHPAEKAVGARMDPFVPFWSFVVEQPPAYSFLAPIRLAAHPMPKPVQRGDLSPDIRFGPLPPVERRIAGVLFDGSVSAILETGAPGSESTEVQVIQPGSTVPSGVPGLPDLTVASITPTEVVLRAQDGRTTTVKLSNVPAAYADAFHNAASGQSAGGSQGQPNGGMPVQGGPRQPMSARGAAGVQ